jgi:Flp pilus assembly pilin Flp
VVVAAQSDPRLKRLFAAGARRLRVADERGAAAIEFALVAPVLLLMLLSMLDGAFSLHQSFQLDHLLRAGSEFAKDDPGVPVVLATMQELAGVDGLSPNVVINTPVRYCLCAAAPAVLPASAPSCTVPCPDGSTPGVAYLLSASLPYNSFVTPSVALFTITSSLSVQVK